MKILGIDIGGSGIKGAPVDIKTGELVTDRCRIPTPQPSTPAAVSEVVAQLAAQFDWKGPMGCTFPAVIKQGIAYTAANVDKLWLGTNIEKLITATTGNPVLLLNDADAAGIAEMEFGAGKGRGGVIIMLTFGTGIGSAIFVDGKLLPNTEFGHLEIRCKEAEHRASARLRKEEELSWERWTERVNEFLQRMENLFWPDLFIFGGGVSQRQKKFFPLLQTRTEIVPALLRNRAGIIGAAIAAGKHFNR
jgi:polyphosphate glucokinase